QARVRRFAIGFGIHGHRAQAERATRADHADRDLPTVRDEDRLHASRAMIMIGWPNSTSWAFSTRMSTMRPRHPVVIEFISFMTSMMQTTSSGPTSPPTSTNGGAPGRGAR